LRRRRSGDEQDAANGGDERREAPTDQPADPPVDSARAGGPWDESEADLDEQNRLHLGGLVLTGRDGLEVRLQVDEDTGQVGAVLLVADDGAVELRAFAAPRNEDLWEDVRRQIAAETTRRGGTATEVDGPYGPALAVRMTGQTPDGQTVTQPSMVLGISGPRWLLRATLLGRPAVEYDRDGLLESALRDVVVVRGSTPMPPGEAIPLTMPAGG
jgi:hypothetical protein